MARILVVEDNDKNRKLLSIILSSKGHKVFEAGDGKEAVEIAGSQKPDLVIMDIQLPGIDGLEATRAIKGGAGTPGIKVLALTAYAMKGDREYFLDSGCDAYLSKPVNIDEMLDLVEKLLNGME